MTDFSYSGSHTELKALPDTELIDLTRRGNGDAFAQLVSRYFTMVHVVAFSYLKDQESAEDLAQEVFLRAYAHLASLRDAQYFPAWLNQIARNHALNWLKRGTKRSRVISMLPLDSYKNAADSSTPSARDNAISNEENRLLEDAILQLPDDLRTTILLHYSADLTKSEIARRLGVHPSSISRQLDKALLILRKKFGEKVKPPAMAIRSRGDSTAKTLAIIAAFAALSNGSKAALLQADGASLMPPPSPGIMTKLVAMTGPGVLTATVISILLLVGTATIFSTGWLHNFNSTRTLPVKFVSAKQASKNHTTPTPETGSNSKPVPASDSREKVLQVSTTENNVIYGQVTTPEGNPVSGARVDVRESGAGKQLLKSTQTDTDGKYELSIDGISRNPVELFASFNGYFDTGIYINGNENQAGTLPFKREANIQMLRGETFSGAIIDEIGNPISNASISMENQTKDCFAAGTHETRSQVDGRFRLFVPTSGTSSLIVEAEGYVPTVETASSPQNPVTIVLKKPGAILTGLALDDTTSAPVAGAGITLTTRYDDISTHTRFHDRVTTTDHAGRFELKNLPAAKYLLRFNKGLQFYIAPDKSPPQSMSFAEPSAPMPQMLFFNVKENSSTTLVLPVYTGHTISGRVTEKGTSIPIEGAIVSAGPEDGEYTTVTDTDGRYTLTNVPANGSYLDRDVVLGFYLMVTKPGYTWPSGDMDEPGHLMILRKDTRVVTADLEVAPTVPVSGVVRSPEGNPLAGARVTRLTRQGIRKYDITTTDKSGRYEFEQESYKTIRIRANAPDYTLGYEARRISGDPVTDMDITLTKPGKLTGIVLDQNNNPVGQAKINTTIYLWDKGRAAGYPVSFDSVNTSSEGKFTFENVPPYEGKLYVEKDGFAKSDGQQFNLKPGETKSGIVIKVKAGLTLQGQLIDKNGNPVKNARVEAMIARTNDRLGSTRTDDGGNFTIDNLSKVPDQLSLWDITSGWMDEVKISGEDITNLRIVLDNTGVTLRGIAIDYLTSAPLTSGMVKLRNKSYNIGTDKPGEFNVPGLMRGTSNSFVVEAPGYLVQEFEVSPETTDQELTQTIVMGPGGIVSGRVLGEKGEPASDVEVQLCDGNGDQMILMPKILAVTRTDEHGNFQFESVKADWMSVIVNPKAPLVPEYETIKVNHGDRIRIPDFKLNRGSQVALTLIEEATGKPMAGVHVKLTGTILNGQADKKTNRAGKVIFNSTYGRRTLVNIPDYHVSDLIELNNEPLLERTYELGKVELKGQIRHNGKPAFATVRLFRTSSNFQTEAVQSDSEGTFEIRNLVAGKWKLNFTWEEDDTQPHESTTEIELPALGTVEKEFNLNQ